MEIKPFITVITPTYNRAELLGYAIESVINQDKTIPFEWEMIICDDGSTDNTKNIVEKYIKDYPYNIFYHYQENSGIPGCARNLGLNYMNKKSNYIIFLDSDDELKEDLINNGLKKIQELKERGLYEKTIGAYFLCEDENKNIIGEKMILQGKNERLFGYEDFLKGEINIEMGIWLKSNIFFNDPRLRFSEEVIDERVMRVQMWQRIDKNGLKIYLWDYVGRFYRLNHSSQGKRICKTISKKRFKSNAEGNKIVLNYIKNDLIKGGYKKEYSEYLFRIGINYVLCGEKKIGTEYIKKSLKIHFSFTVLGILIISKISKNLVLLLYKYFVNN